MPLTIFVLGRVSMGLLLVISGLAKLRHRGSFVDVRVVPPKVKKVVERIVPPLEIATGTLMVAGWETAIVSAIGVALFVAFALFVALALRRAPDAGCGCFGNGTTVSRALVVRNLGLALLALASGVVPNVGLVAAAILVFSLGTLPSLKRSSSNDPARGVRTAS